MTPSGIKCRIWYDLDVQAYRISCGYNNKFIEFLKVAIPTSDRAYDPTTKIWVFQEKWFDIVCSTAQGVWGGGNVTIQNKASAQTAASSNANTSVAPARQAKLDDVIISFFKLLPVNAVRKAYQTAAVELHPDRGGDAVKMRQLNEYWSRIKTELKI